MQDDFVTPKPSDPVLDDRLLELYISGECTLSEQAAVERWLNGNPAQGRAIRAMRIAGMAEAFGGHHDIDLPLAEQQIISRSGFLVPPAPAGFMMHRIFRRETPPTGMPPGVLTPQSSSSLKGLSKRAFWSAAVLSIAVAATLIVTSVLNHAGRGATKSVAMSTYTTGQGERATVRLPDGTIVKLNVSSQLDVPSNYLDGNRALRLSGEAMFDVVGQRNAPFTVNAGGTVTKVLGTQFLVRHYTTDTVTTVGVQSGKVSVSGTVLTPLQQAVLTPARLLTVSAMNAGQRTFADGVLALDGMMLSQAIADLNRWYNVDIRLGDSSIATQRLRGELEAGSTGDLMEVLEVTLAVRVVRDGRVLTLYPRRGQ